ncbi:MAG: hypothetical protein PCFJNLEI_01015 [Verrucomicrobiae bacterium]|nr:hypothetical protein [Verrucomicrobiae bacterium]
MKTPETSRLFTRWKNPNSGVASWILTERLAPVQQSFYYTHPSFTDDGRFLWLGCGFPPAGGRYAQQVLGVVDFERDEMRVYPETQFPSARPVVDRTTGDVYWGNQLDIWKRGPEANDQPVLVNRFPKELAHGKLERLATHPTFSADRRSLNLDTRFVLPNGNAVTHIGELPLDGAPYVLWQTVENQFLDHALFSPTDPAVQMVAYEYWQDHKDRQPFDGAQLYHRLWWIRRGEKLRPILQEPVSHSGHEWWDSGGQHVWYVHYGVGIKKVNLATRAETIRWPGHLAHGHSDRTGRYLVTDRMADPVVSDCHVAFLDTVTGRQVEIVNRPPLAAGLTQCVHLHPHPQFCQNDRYICYTTTVHDRVDVALVTVTDLNRFN